MAREILPSPDAPLAKRDLRRPLYLIAAVAGSGVLALWAVSRNGNDGALELRPDDAVLREDLAPDHQSADVLATWAVKQQEANARAQEQVAREPPPDALTVLRGKVPKVSDIPEPSGAGPDPTSAPDAWAPLDEGATSALETEHAKRETQIELEARENVLRRRLARAEEAQFPKSLILDEAAEASPARTEEQREAREDEQMDALSSLSNAFIQQSAEQVRGGAGGQGGASAALGALSALGDLSMGAGGGLGGGSPTAEMVGRHGRQLDFFQRGGQQLDTGYLATTVQKPMSRYELRSGTVIPGMLVSAIDTDSGPGQVVGKITENVYSTTDGFEHLLIPMGSSVVITYAGVELGQERLGMAAAKIVMPNADALDLGSMAITDETGRAGLKDKVNHHMLRRIAAALLTATATVGYQVTRPSNVFGVEGAVHQGLGESVMKLANDMAARNASIPPTIEIRPGNRFAIVTNKDIVFPGPYEDGKPHRKRDLRQRAKARATRGPAS